MAWGAEEGFAKIRAKVDRYLLEVSAWVEGREGRSVHRSMDCVVDVEGSCRRVDGWTVGWVGWTAGRVSMRML